MKKWYKLIIAVLMLWILIIGAAAIIIPDKEQSESENRALKQKPELSLKTLFSGGYTSEYEEYFADQFPARDMFSGINKNMNTLYYFSGPGDENTLIIDFNQNVAMGGESLAAQNPAPSPETLKPSASPDLDKEPDDADNAPEPTPESTPEISVPDAEDTVQVDGSSVIIVGDNAMDIPHSNYEVIADYTAALNKIKSTLGPDINVYSLLTPNSGEFYSPEALHTGAYSQKEMIEYAYGQMEDIIIVDAYAKLRMHADEYIFFRTDHHWTQLGAYYAYTAFCESAGFEAVPLSSFETGRYTGFVGTMYKYTSAYPQSQALLDNPDYLDYYVPVADCSAWYYFTAEMIERIPMPVVDRNLSDSITNKYLCFISGDTPLSVIETDVDGPVCLLIKESYGNAFAPFLTSHYNKIFIIDVREWYSVNTADEYLQSFVADNNVDDVICLNYPFMINNSYYVSLLEAMIK